MGTTLLLVIWIRFHHHNSTVDHGPIHILATFIVGLISSSYRELGGKEQKGGGCYKAFADTANYSTYMARWERTLWTL